MGQCGAMLTYEEKAERARAKAVNEAIAEAEAVDTALVKLLLLGAGESGKSTIFKQARVRTRAVRTPPLSLDTGLALRASSTLWGGA